MSGTSGKPVGASAAYALLTADDFDTVMDVPPEVRSRFFAPSLLDTSPDLKAAAGGLLLPGPLGLPHCGRGSFAVVYRLRRSDGTTVALRCLLGPPDRDAAQRSNALPQHLAGLNQPLPYLVTQRFHDAALQVAGARRPVFIMDWVEGVDLLTAARDHIARQDLSGLAALARAVGKMVVELQQADMAHGDLQHGNILVNSSGGLRLVDYDSFFVPSLAAPGLHSPVGGTPGYTHPAYAERTVPRPLAVTNDTFAATVLVLSLRALAADPSLFVGEVRERLILTGEELDDPTGNPIWARFAASPDPCVVEIATLLRRWCLQPAAESEVRLTDVPQLAALLGIAPAWPLRTPPPPRIKARPDDLPKAPPLWQARPLVSLRYLQSAQVLPQPTNEPAPPSQHSFNFEALNVLL